MKTSASIYYPVISDAYACDLNVATNATIEQVIIMTYDGIPSVGVEFTIIKT